MSVIKTEEAPWTEVLTPKVGLFDLRLGDIFRYKDLLFLFVKRDFTAQYKQTILGPLWHLIQPLFSTLIFFILFNSLAKIPTDNIPPVLFYMSSLTIWNFFSSCLTSTSSTFISNANIFGKVYFPRLVLPLSVIMSNLVRFGIQFCLLIGIMLYFLISGKFSYHFGLHTLLLPFIAFTMAALGLGLGIIISSLTTKYRDFNVLITFGVQLLMYLTPVAYPLSFIMKSKYKYFMIANPLSSLVEGFRYALFGVGSINYMLFGYSILFTIIAVFTGVVIFNKVERSFMDTV